MGSTRGARRAGRYAATSAAALSRTTHPAMVAGSVGVKPNNSSEDHRDTAQTASSPRAIPIATKRFSLNCAEHRYFYKPSEAALIRDGAQSSDRHAMRGAPADTPPRAQRR